MTGRRHCDKCFKDHPFTTYQKYSACYWHASGGGTLPCWILFFALNVLLCFLWEDHSCHPISLFAMKPPFIDYLKRLDPLPSLTHGWYREGLGLQVRTEEVGLHLPPLILKKSLNPKPVFTRSESHVGFLVCKCKK
jgi:hypothetical protein